MTLDEFSEIVERMCVCGWRSVLGRNNSATIRGVNSVMVTHSDVGGTWEFSFCLRYGKGWHQAVERMAPVDHSPMDMDNDPPSRVASELSFRLMERVAEDMNLTAAQFGGNYD